MERGDEVFLAAVSSRLVHDMIQVLFALNREYYVGDGNNLHYVEQFSTRPRDFTRQVKTILYPPQTEDRLHVQHEAIINLIDDLASLVARAKTEDAPAGNGSAGDGNGRA